MGPPKDDDRITEPELNARSERPASGPTSEDAESSHPSTAPTSAAGRYEVRAVLGRGGTATVHLALDRILQREVALKFLEVTETSPALLERFVVEAQITAQLDHPNVVPVHDLSMFGDPPYFVMKVLGGQTLTEHLKKRPILPRDPETLDDLLGVFVKVCDAVAFAHSRGVVHRDLKPDNVTVDTYGRVYLMDWGLARVLPGSHAGRIDVALQNAGDDGSGTVAYMSPEQARPGWRPIGPWTDIYALGAILYEILTGRPPHVADNYYALRVRAFDGNVAPPETHVPGGLVAPALSRIVMRATAREPNDRYESVEDLKRDIERFVGGGGTRFSSRTYEKGEIVVREGEVGDHAFVIRQGRAVAYKTVGEERIVLREMEPGDAFGEMALLAETPRTATVEAIEPLALHVVDRESLNQGLGLDSWTGAVVRALAERFRDIDAKLTTAELELRRLKANLPSTDVHEPR
jgi:serine/threonine-protein kinase